MTWNQEDAIPPEPDCPVCGKELSDDTMYVKHYRCTCGWSGFYTDLKPHDCARVNEWFAKQESFYMIRNCFRESHKRGLAGYRGEPCEWFCDDSQCDNKPCTMREVCKKINTRSRCHLL